MLWSYFIFFFFFTMSKENTVLSQWQGWLHFSPTNRVSMNTVCRSKVIAGPVSGWREKLNKVSNGCRQQVWIIHRLKCFHGSASLPYLFSMVLMVFLMLMENVFIYWHIIPLTWMVLCFRLVLFLFFISSQFMVIAVKNTWSSNV